MRKSLYIILVMSLVAGCTTTQNISVPASQFSSMYNPSEFSLNADYKLYHISDEMTSMFIRLFPRELLFNQANEEGEYRALVGVTYIIYELGDNREIVAKSDSTTFQIKLDREDQESTAYFSSRVLSIKSGKQYMIRIESKDLLRGSVGLEHIYIDKRNRFSAQNFSIVSARTGYPRFLNYIAPGEVFKLNYRMPGYDSIFVDFIKLRENYPRPPLTMNSPSFFAVEPDTTVRLAWTDSTIFTLPDKGMYHFRLDTTRPEGMTFHRFGPDFPQVQSEEALREPLFYIATLTEYNNLRRAENTKLAVDNFWMARASSLERSRELIRVYYNRVLYSNLYFTTNREGWKTDRGMSFILFGPPDRIRSGGSEERWYYISSRQGKVIEFIFDRVPGLYSNHDLVWRKNGQSIGYVSAAMSSWRSGKVYSLSR
jgi:GWxTD domain-containing protein